MTRAEKIEEAARVLIGSIGVSLGWAVTEEQAQAGRDLLSALALPPDSRRSPHNGLPFSFSEMLRQEAVERGEEWALSLPSEPPATTATADYHGSGVCPACGSEASVVVSCEKCAPPVAAREGEWQTAGMTRTGPDDPRFAARDEGRCLCGQTASGQNANGIWVWPKGHAGYEANGCCRKPEEACSECGGSGVAHCSSCNGGGINTGGEDCQDCLKPKPCPVCAGGRS